MFRLHRSRQVKSGEKFDFKFSNFKALQVTKGWDKLFVSIVSDQTGKTIVRSSKASVRNGSCQWTESLSESIWVPQDELSKEFEDCNIKLVVSMGSGRSNILGEAMVNMKSYIDSKSSAISLPLKKCNHGTILQVKIECLTPVTKVRNGELKQTNFPKEDLKKEGDDSYGCSDITDSQLSRSIESSSDADLYSSLHSREPSSKEPSFSASNSQLSNDSSETYESIENDAAKNNCDDIQRQDSVSSQNSAPCLSPNSVITGSAEATPIEELRADARMWERNAHKLMLDLDQLKKEFSDQSQIQESLNTALSAATIECDGLRNELEQLKLSHRQPTIQEVSYQDGEPHFLIELKDELQFQKEFSANLAQQIKRSQESNIELVTVLQELEETIEKQKLEMEEVLAQHIKDDDIKNIENKKLMLQLEQLKESEKNLQLKVELMERNLEETKLDLKKSEVANQKFEEDMGSLHSVNINLVKEIDMLKEELGSLHSVNINLVKEIDMLKEEMQELEKDCNELTDENIDLLYKIKQANKDLKGGGSMFNSTGGELLSNSFVNFGFDTTKHKHSTQNLEDDPINTVENKRLESVNFELEVRVEELSRELTEKKLEIEKLESSILSKEDEIKTLGDLHNKLDAKYEDLQSEKNQIEEKMEVILGESDISSKCINDLQNEVKVLRNSVDLHVSANKTVEEKSTELECEKRELEFHVSQMEQESTQLSDCISVLESQLKHMTDEKESIRLELENLKSRAVDLQDEVDRLRLEIQTGSVDHKKMLKDVQNQCVEVKDQCEYLQRENKKLEAAAEHYVEEQNLLHKSNGELKKKNLEFHECYLRLESKFEESLERSAHYFKRLDEFEDYVSLGLEDFASKERFLSSELNSIVEDDIKYKEKFAMFESLYSEAYLEKATKAQELQGAVVHLTKQLSATNDDLNILKMESDEKLKALICELSSSKQSQEKLITDHEKLVKQLENYKSLEVKLKRSVNDLESKLSVSEKERKHHEEELMNFRNSTYQQKLKILEEEKDEWLKRSQSLEAELKLLKEEKQIHRDSSSAKVHSFFKTIGKNMPTKDVKFLKNDVVKIIGQNHGGKKKIALKTSQSHELVKDPKGPNSYQSQIKDDSGCDIHDDGLRVLEAESLSRIQLLEKELAVALEANKKYQDQLNRLVPDKQNNNKKAPNATVEGSVVGRERHESINSGLEAELKDIRERYFSISLKYAEVEHEREELVMKLKEAKSGGKGWLFS